MAASTIIQIKTLTTEADDELHGCPIVDTDDEIVFVRVPLSEIDCDYSVNGGVYLTDVWGARQLVEEVEIEVHRCKWEGHAVLNDEEVAEELLLWSNET